VGLCFLCWAVNLLEHQFQLSIWLSQVAGLVDSKSVAAAVRAVY
jgi:hypothetical protein